MNELLKNVLDFWKNLEAARQKQLMLASVLVALLVVGLSYWMLRTDYQVLFADLEPRDAANIVEELKRMKVNYRLEQGESRILVDGKRVHETRLALMSRNLSLSGGVGFEIFDNKDVGLTESTQKINFLRALQGELSRTIMAVNEVKYARVHLVVAEAGLFKRTKAEPKASVTLVLKPGAVLRPEQISGIQRLVAAAVPGLDTRQVIISDQRGVTLSTTQDDDGFVGPGNAKLRVKKQVEDHILHKVMDVLNQSLGQGKVVVGVNVTLNFDEIKRTQENIIPANRTRDGATGAVLRQRTTMRQDGRSAPSAGNAAEPGATTATQPATPGPQQATTDIEYVFGRTVEHVVASPGWIQRMTVSVVVPAGQEDDQITRIREIVSAAAGLNPDRGDTISIQPIDRMMRSPAVSQSAVSGPTPDGTATTGLSATVSSWLESARRFLSQSSTAWSVTVALLAFIALTSVIVLMARKFRRISATGLDEGSREQLLAEIREWLSQRKDSTADTHRY